MSADHFEYPDLALVVDLFAEYGLDLDEVRQLLAEVA